VHAEAEQPDHRHRRQRRARAQRHQQAFARARHRQHQERERQPGRDLDAHARRQRRRADPRTGRRERQREREREQQQRVVVGATDAEHQQHGVQADERHRPAWRVSRARRRPREQRHRGEAGHDSDRLERPQAAGEPQRRDRVADEREQRAVWRVKERPADEVEHRVPRGLRGEVRVRIETVQRAQPRERQVPEHVLGDERRPQQQRRVSEHDRTHERGRRQPTRGEQHQRVARTHQQRQRLEAVARQADPQPRQRPCQPRGPAAAACGDVQRRRRGCARADQEHAGDHTDQPDSADRLHHAPRSPRACRPASAPSAQRGHARSGCRAGGRYAAIVASGARGRPRRPVRCAHSLHPRLGCRGSWSP
jgi:hypothetical protein